MTDQQWEKLKKVINGEVLQPLPMAFIIDSPWLPNWFGIKIIEYFSSEELWFKANLKAINNFPDVIFLPGFWSEFGMCTEPSAFGVKCTFPPDEFPFAHKIIRSVDDIDSLEQPNPKTDGLLPFMLNRLKIMLPRIEDAGHKIRFAVARGPLNIASYLMGSTEFLTTMMMQPDKTHLLLRKITDYLKDWLQLQMETFLSIDGIFLLDDIIGFMGENEFKEFGLPYFKELFNENVSVKFLHNDAPCRISAPYLPEMGVNLFNMGFDVSLNELKELTQNKVTLVGNIPPRDVLANGSQEDVSNAVVNLINSLKDKSRIILSCGGGMPPGVTTDNILTFIETVKNIK
ncbi:MAG: uroporphyrinogen decarboxylase family protein [Melioribacter sp.]|uniref:uroporphyrinogen decarboxylase family protein n=1 Tax=Rosettibacter primus TaxID=3111523 RepID=UPI00247ECEFD|nr:uroporphyrinogen decarboxylase family protein [Melioribacter sp.]